MRDSQKPAIPQTYSEWMTTLDALESREHDSEILDVIRQGKLTWQSGAAERFFKRFSGAVNGRMDMASDKFQREMQNAGGHEGRIVCALLSLRREMSFLTQVVKAAAIPKETSEKYCALVRGQADNIQNSLEDSAKRDRTGKLGSIIRNNRVNMID